jgi:hypothetical protein
MAIVADDRGELAIVLERLATELPIDELKNLNLFEISRLA